MRGDRQSKEQAEYLACSNCTTEGIHLAGSVEEQASSAQLSVSGASEEKRRWLTALEGLPGSAAVSCTGLRPEMGSLCANTNTRSQQTGHKMVL